MGIAWVESVTTSVIVVTTSKKKAVKGMGANMMKGPGENTGGIGNIWGYIFI